jgi:hypothetical protein
MPDIRMGDLLRITPCGVADGAIGSMIDQQLDHTRVPIGVRKGLTQVEAGRSPDYRRRHPTACPLERPLGSQRSKEKRCATLAIQGVHIDASMLQQDGGYLGPPVGSSEVQGRHPGIAAARICSVLQEEGCNSLLSVDTGAVERGEA